MVHDTQPPLLEIDNASVVLGATRALDGLTLSIGAGEHAAILGPNGAGKSTLMKLLTLQVYPFAASNGTPPVRIFGKERWDVMELRSQLGIVSADLHDRFVHGNASGLITGHDAVLSGFFASQGLFAHQHVTEAMRSAATEALDNMGALHLSAATMDTMSTGEARRVLIARALAHGPRALFLDEPTRGLDVAAQHDFMERVRGLARRGTTIVLVTHHAEEIIPEIDRVILLSRGRVAYDGSKASVMTSARLSEVFGVSLAVAQANGYYHVRVRDRGLASSGEPSA
jgi:iron complex transport system ATP-binding protein